MDTLSLIALWGFIVLIAGGALWIQYDLNERRARLVKTFSESSLLLASFIPKHFLVRACSRCHESEMMFLRPSPNGRSVECQCGTCSKKFWFAASSENASDIGQLVNRRTELFVEILTRKAVPEQQAPMLLPLYFLADDGSPNERTRREPIPEAVRHEVWRRDHGRCVVCGGKERLEFDHIIPVSEGGANTARNLQLLCEKCNRQKAARV